MRRLVLLFLVIGMMFVVGCGSGSPTSTGTQDATKAKPKPEPKPELKDTPKYVPEGFKGPGQSEAKSLDPKAPGGPGNATKKTGPRGAGDEVIK